MDFQYPPKCSRSMVILASIFFPVFISHLSRRALWFSRIVPDNSQGRECPSLTSVLYEKVIFYQYQKRNCGNDFFNSGIILLNLGNTIDRRNLYERARIDFLKTTDLGIYLIPFDFFIESLPGYSKHFGCLKFVPFGFKERVFDAGDFELFNFVRQEKC